MLPDCSRVAAIIREVAEEELLPRFRRLAAEEVWRKPRGDFATVADLESERRLVARLTALLPGSVVLAEEDASAHPGTFDRLREEAPVWIVDPLDGTKNFAEGREGFAVIVALFHRGAARAGWILAPISGALAMVEEGGGAWMDGRRLRVRPGAPVGRMTGSLGFRLRRKRQLRAQFGRVTNLGCCGIEYMALADGGLHFAYYRRLKPWDHTAGDLLVREAGGQAKGLDSEAPYRPAAPDHNGLLLACDAESWRAVASLLRPAVAALG